MADEKRHRNGIKISVPERRIKTCSQTPITRKLPIALPTTTVICCGRSVMAIDSAACRESAFTNGFDRARIPKRSGQRNSPQDRRQALRQVFEKYRLPGQTSWTGPASPKKGMKKHTGCFTSVRKFKKASENYLRLSSLAQRSECLARHFSCSAMSSGSGT